MISYDRIQSTLQKKLNSTGKYDLPNNNNKIQDTEKRKQLLGMSYAKKKKNPSFSMLRKKTAKPSPIVSIIRGLMLSTFHSTEEFKSPIYGK